MDHCGKVTVIILNWNGRHFLEQNLESGLSQEYENYEVLIVDNGSTDGSQKYVQDTMKKEKRLKLLETGENLGYAEGNNRGIRYVLKEGKSEYIVLLNNDVKVDKSWLTNLTSGFSDQQIGVCTSKILLYYPYQHVVLIPSSSAVIYSININGIDYHSLEFAQGFDKKGGLISFPKRLNAGEIYNFAIPYDPCDIGKSMLKIKFKGKSLKVFAGSLKKELDKDGSMRIPLKGKYVIQNAGIDLLRDRMVFEDRHIYEFDRDLPTELVEAGCGAAMAVRTDLIRRLGEFNGKYFMYFEDCELCIRYQRAGFKTKFINNAICYHHFWGSSAGKITRLQTFYGTRNRLWFTRRYFGLLKYLYFYARTLARTAIWAVKSPFSENARMYFSSYVRALGQALESDR